MPMAGFEPARISSPPPQDGVSANFTTSANDFSIHSRGLLIVYCGTLFHKHHCNKIMLIDITIIRSSYIISNPRE